MRLLNLIKGDCLFIWKYGVIILYSVFTICYLIFLGLLPTEAKTITAYILIFSDPCAMGLFFMGAVILLERSQKIDSSLAISPVKTYEYIIAKVLPFLIVGVIVSIIIGLYTLTISFAMIIGVLLSSIVFSLGGIFVGVKARSLNDFMLKTVPFEISIFLPAILFQFNVISNPWWLLMPGVSAIYLINGGGSFILLAIISLLLWITIFFVFTKKALKKSYQKIGGGKL